MIELGNGDKFIFDMGNGSFERIHALGIPLDYLDKVFITHPHMDHMADLATFYMTGPQNNRSVPLRVWGPGGGGMRPEWGMKAAMDHMEKMWAWMSGTLEGTIDTTAFKLEVTEYDWSKVNNVIYEDNGVVIRSLPAIHFEGTASFILEWNGLRLAFSGDSLPNKWWIEHTQGVDLSIHECFFTPEMAMSKWSFSSQEALNAVTTIHANPSYFAKVMAMTKPKHAVAYHFQNDFDTQPIIRKAVEQVYDGPVDYAEDFMVWNVTKEGVRTRMAVVNPEAYPPPPLKEKKIEAGGDRYQTPDSVLAGWPEEFNALADKIYSDFNTTTPTAGSVNSMNGRFLAHPGRSNRNRSDTVFLIKSNPLQITESKNGTLVYGNVNYHQKVLPRLLNTHRSLDDEADCHNTQTEGSSGAAARHSHKPRSPSSSVSFCIAHLPPIPQ